MRAYPRFLAKMGLSRFGQVLARFCLVFGVTTAFGGCKGRALRARPEFPNQRGVRKLIALPGNVVSQENS